MALSNLDRSILRALIYFDHKDYPLTVVEVCRWLYLPDCGPEECDLAKVKDALAHSQELKEHVETKEGFYYLNGRSELVVIRRRRNGRVAKQLKKTARIVKLLRLFPPIRLIAVTSSVSFGCVKKNSDIDLFIITRQDQIWLARFLAAGLLKLLNQRPTARHKRDRFCLSFFITEDALAIEHGAFGSDDILYHYYLQSILPIYDPDNLHDRFRLDNDWLYKYIPNADQHNQVVTKLSRPWWLKAWHNFFDVITFPFVRGPMGEWYVALQNKILPRQLKSMANVDTSVVLSDTMLKFYDKDIRRQIAKKWQEKMQQFE